MRLSKAMILQGLRRFGELANAENIEIELVIVGGTVMVLEFNTREETEDVDVVLSTPSDWQIIQYLAVKVAAEYKLDVGWINAAAKIFYMNPPPAKSKLLFSSTGITLYRPSTEQLLAKKLALSRSYKAKIDWNDAKALLENLSDSFPDKGCDEIYNMLLQFIHANERASTEINFRKLWNEVFKE